MLRKRNISLLIVMAAIILLVFGLSACKKGRQTDEEKDQAAVTKEKVPGMLLDCDSMEGISVESYNKSFGITSAEGEYQKGTGALRSEGRYAVWWQIVLENPVDISSYAEGGIHLWLYVNDITKLNQDVTINLGSSGKEHSHEYQWMVKREKLTDGWNELTLRFSSAEAASDGGADLSRVDYFRVYNSTNDGVTVLLDDVRAVEVEHRIVGLANCDDTSGINFQEGKDFVHVTNEQGEYKEGTGAFKSNRKGAVTWSLELNSPQDVSSCTEGKLHFWFYVNDVEKLTEDWRVEIGSGGTYDVNECQWTMERDTLTNGWNECWLLFENAQPSSDGGPDYSKINWFRIYTLNSGEIITMIDDIYTVY